MHQILFKEKNYGHQVFAQHEFQPVFACKPPLYSYIIQFVVLLCLYKVLVASILSTHVGPTRLAAGAHVTHLSCDWPLVHMSHTSHACSFYRITRIFCREKLLCMSQINQKIDPLLSNFCVLAVCIFTNTSLGFIVAN